MSDLDPQLWEQGSGKGPLKALDCIENTAQLSRNTRKKQFYICLSRKKKKILHLLIEKKKNNFTFTYREKQKKFLHLLIEVYYL
jgi:hypothetical protein